MLKPPSRVVLPKAPITSGAKMDNKPEPLCFETPLADATASTTPPNLSPKTVFNNGPPNCISEPIEELPPLIMPNNSLIEVELCCLPINKLSKLVALCVVEALPIRPPMIEAKPPSTAD